LFVMVDLDEFAQLVPLDHGLSVVVTRRPDLTPHTSVVNAGVLRHPTTAVESVAFVSVSSSRKLANLRKDPTIAVVIRAGWQWVSVEGQASLVGPDDPDPGVDDEQLRLLLREIFTSAGGMHDDWPEFDRTMREERRTAVFVAPQKMVSRLR
jgi:PPOX class probable F420-dependent enzyme